MSGLLAVLAFTGAVAIFLGWFLWMDHLMNHHGLPGWAFLALTMGPMFALALTVVYMAFS